MSLAQGVVVMSVAALAIEAHRVATAVAAFQKVLAAPPYLRVVLAIGRTPAISASSAQRSPPPTRRPQ